MQDIRFSSPPPKHAALRWLTDPGCPLSAQVGGILLGEIFGSPKAVFAGLINALIINVVALCLHGGRIFGCFILADLALAMLRIAARRRMIGGAALGLQTSTDLNLILACCWCALQGAMVFVSMRTNLLPLQLLSAAFVMGLSGPICARYYAAPRFAIMLVMFCVLPFAAGGALSGDPWLLILPLEAPVFLLGVLTTTRRFQSMAIKTLQAEQDSFYRARHDALTGLLNRFGLMEALNANSKSCSRYILFYLDLDGFKPINDTFGHQAGDAVLHAVADRIRSTICEGDIASRLGGDEFVIVAPNMLPASGIEFANRMIHRIADEQYGSDSIAPLRVGISIGFVCVPDDGLDEDDLHRKADAALYEAKAAGKGTYRRFTSSTSTPSSAKPRSLLPELTR